MNSTYPFAPTFSNTGWNFGTPFNAYPSFPAFPFWGQPTNWTGTPGFGSGFGTPITIASSPTFGGWGNWNNPWNTFGSFPWSNWNVSNGFGFGTPSNLWGATATPWNAAFPTNFFNGYNNGYNGFSGFGAFPWNLNAQGWTPFASYPGFIPGFFPGFAPAPINQGTAFQGVGAYAPASYPFNGYAGANQGIRNNGTGTPAMNPQGIREAA